MVYTFILLSFLLSYSASFASGGDSEFSDMTEKTTDSLRKILRSNSYGEAQQLIDHWLTEYNKLGSTKKDEFKHVEKNMYFLSACVLAEDGETSRALSALNEAIVKGYRNYDQIIGDKHLKRLHGIREFTSLTERLQERTDYLSILKTSNDYSVSSTSLPTLRYSHSGNTDLTRLRSMYNLDSIACIDNERERFINVMNWVHNRIAHNGNKVIQEKRDALSLLDDNNALDCRGLATILSEAYLSLGYPSRITLCMPKDHTDGESHAVVSVYSDHYSRWVMMDPTSSAYICDTNGQLLGLREIREKMISGESIILNPDANWNGTVSRTIDEYLYMYMAKNMYWFETPVINTFGSETFTSGKQVDYVRLYPPGYKTEEGKSISYLHGNVFITTSENIFWQTPK
ncbi:MAG TPA: transglutaminase-like domain-containing protein [Candidatus Kapabacteria bacterium]